MIGHTEGCATRVRPCSFLSPLLIRPLTCLSARCVYIARVIFICCSFYLILLPQGTKEAAVAGAAGLLGGRPSVLGLSPRLVAKGLAAANNSGTAGGGGGASSGSKAGDSANSNSADGGGGGAATADGEGDGVMGEELYQVLGSLLPLLGVMGVLVNVLLWLGVSWAALVSAAVEFSLVFVTRCLRCRHRMSCRDPTTLKRLFFAGGAPQISNPLYEPVHGKHHAKTPTPPYPPSSGRTLLRVYSFRWRLLTSHTYT